MSNQHKFTSATWLECNFFQAYHRSSGSSCWPDHLWRKSFDKVWYSDPSCARVGGFVWQWSDVCSFNWNVFHSCWTPIRSRKSSSSHGRCAWWYVSGKQSAMTAIVCGIDKKCFVLLHSNKFISCVSSKTISFFPPPSFRPPCQNRFTTSAHSILQRYI